MKKIFLVIYSPTLKKNILCRIWGDSLYDIKYIMRSWSYDQFSCKILVSSHHSYEEWLIITAHFAEDDHLIMYYNKISPTKRIIGSSAIKDVQEISNLHNQFFLLLVRNADVIKNGGGQHGFVLDKELFFIHIFPNMQEVC